MELGYTEQYTIHRMVFVNSGSSAYVELPMDKTAALFGRNNEGKTSGLSALKLFVLPEVNFKNCQTKFGFGSGGDLYTAPQSYQHYFPDNSSFIILEAENPKNRFCIVLHRSNEEWGYSRIAVPLPYDDIKSLFWNFDSLRNSGRGEPIADLRLADVLSALKKRKGLVLNTVQDIREAIYRRPGVLEDSSRYCIVPLLQKGEAGSVKALSALLGLAFDIKGKLGGSLPNAIATIIEGEIGSSENKIDIDIGGISSQYDELKHRNHYLNVVRDSLPKWKELEAAYSELLKADTTIRTRYSELMATLRHQESIEAERVGDLRAKRKVADDDAKAAKEARSNNRRELQTLTTQRKTKQTDLESAQNDLARVKEVLGEAKILGLEEIEAVYGWLEEYIAERTETLEALQDLDAGQRRLEKLNQQATSLNQSIEEAERSVTEVAAGFLEALPPNTRDVLFSLNPKLAEVNVAPNDEQATTIIKFSELLGQEDEALTFLGSPVPQTRFAKYNLEAERQRRQTIVDELKGEHKAVVEKRNKLNTELKNHMAGLSRERVSSLKDEIEAATKDIGLLEGRRLREAQQTELEQEVSFLNEAIEVAEEQKEVYETRHNEAVTIVAGLDGELAAAEPLISELRDMRRTVEQEIGRLQHADARFSAEVAPTEGTVVDIEVLRERVGGFIEAAGKYPALHYQVIQTFSLMFEYGILQSEGSPIHMPRPPMTQLSGWYEELRAEFTHLEGNLQKHKNDIIHHNHTTSTRADMLRQLGRTIRESENQINQELARYQISNLESTQVKLELDPRFESLLKDFSNESFQASEQLRSKTFYERLSSFCDEFFKDGRSGKKIDLASVVTGVAYSFMKDGELTKAGQSNGTTSMLNSAMLAILLKRLIPAGVTLKFPIVFDEVGSLDKPNLQAVKQVAEDHGFLLFVANPENTGVIGSTVDHWYDLSLLRVTEGQVVKHCTVLYYQLEEGFRPAREHALELEA